MPAEAWLTSKAPAASRSTAMPPSVRAPACASCRGLKTFPCCRQANSRPTRWSARSSTSPIWAIIWNTRSKPPAVPWCCRRTSATTTQSAPLSALHSTQHTLRHCRNEHDHSACPHVVLAEAARLPPGGALRAAVLLHRHGAADPLHAGRQFQHRRARADGFLRRRQLGSCLFRSADPEVVVDELPVLGGRRNTKD